MEFENKEIFEELVKLLSNTDTLSKERLDAFLCALSNLENINYIDEKGRNIVHYFLISNSLNDGFKRDLLIHAVEVKKFDLNSTDNDGLNILSYFLDFLLFKKEKNKKILINPDEYSIIKYFINQKINLMQGYGSWNSPIQIARELNDLTILALMGDNDE